MLVASAPVSAASSRAASELTDPIALAGVMAIALLFASLAVLVYLVRARTRLQRALHEADERYRLLAGASSDIVLRLDLDGMVDYASPAAARTGLWGESDPTGRSIAELMRPDGRLALGALLDAAKAGTSQPGWHEFGLSSVSAQALSEQWFELRLEPLRGRDGTVRGVVAVLRSIAERKALEEQLYEAGLTDPQTGLSNRRAFIAMLEHHLAERADGCIALFDLDHFRALNDRHGHVVGDKVLVLFAQLLRSLVRSGDTVARIGGEKFGVLFPGASTDQAEAAVARVLATLSGTSRAVDNTIVRVSASAGVARIAESADEALRSADLALQVAKAKGRDRLELAPRLRIDRHSRW